MRTIVTIILALTLTCNIATAQDTLYIYKSGMVVSKRAVAEIDSVIFYKAATIPQGNTVTDIDGNVYHTVTIGTQVWMVENLKTTKYNDGASIPNVTDNTQWGNLTTGAYCWYNNDAANKTTYGALYNWYTVNTGKLAPTGWHVPTDAEWTTLTTYLGGESVAGGKLKETGTAHWQSPNKGATNETGFTAFPSGTRDGSYSVIGYGGYWWSSTEFDAIGAWYRTLTYNDSNSYRDGSFKSCGFSVRCVKD